MGLPATAYGLPFNITRASHAELLVADLERSLRFYLEVIGLALTERDERTAYLRGMEESCHHSLVLRVSPDASRSGKQSRGRCELRTPVAARGLRRSGPQL